LSESLFHDDVGDQSNLLDRYVRVVVERGIDAAPPARAATQTPASSASPPTEPAATAGFTYRLRRGDEGVRVGERIHVPLGRGNRPAAGIVVEVGGPELLGDLPAAKAKPITKATGIRLPDPLIELARWMADFYVCPLGMVLGAMLPAAVKKSIGRKKRIEIDFAHDSQSPDAIDTTDLPPTAAHAWAALCARPDLLPGRAKDVASALDFTSVAPLGRLLRLGLLREVERTVYVSPPMPWEGLQTEALGSTDEVNPTQPQRDIIQGISRELGSFSTHLLRGVTGSGKTEVYLRLMEHVLCPDDNHPGAQPGAQRNAQSDAQPHHTVLMLVPEIGLTPQTAGRILRRFGDDRVAVLHSGLTASQRNRQWMHANSGECRVVIGARSAIFAPLPHLRLIIVDEEHASDYKQDQLPRYSARDVAIKRAQIENCPVVLGSATPSLESWSNARAGRSKLWTLADRVGGGQLPRVEVIDMLKEGRAPSPSSESKRELRAIGRTLETALRHTLDAGGQAILLLNRRGYSNVLACPSAPCGWVLQCDDCDATMVLHRHRGLPVGEVLRCHHCFAERLVPRACPDCGCTLTPLGMGTQRLERELIALLPQLGDEGALLRIDGDTMRNARDHFAALSRFASGEVRVLMGTQIVSKGLDFPNVRLVGVVSADTALWMPDFRASERTFQLVSQVAGRTGRGAAGGRVIVQTLNPTQPAIRHAAHHAYEAFADEELAIRTRSALPPSTRMARIVIRDTDREAAQARADDLANRLRAAASAATAQRRDGAALNSKPRTTSLRVVGPMPAPIERVARHHRIAIELFAPTATALLGPLRHLRAQGLLKSDAHTAVDVDPVWLM
jgi:primosomal protein N' (replication factor Y) (superfamily II helicase)